MHDRVRDAVEAVVEVASRRLFDPPSGDEPVVRLAGPDELRAEFAEVAALDLEPVVEPLGADMVGRVAELIANRSVQTAHPRFFNQNFAGPDPVGVAGDWLGAVLNTTNATFEAAPVFTLMEQAVLRKLAALAGLGHDGRLPPGLFAPGGSTGALYALQLARHRRWPDVVRSGMVGERPALFVSDAGHYSALKCAALLGLGRDAVAHVATDDSGAMRIDALDAAIDHSVTEGKTPFAVIATAGTTVTSAFDPIDEIADVCDAHELWLHVDGSYGASALFSSNQRHRLGGIERADSLVWNLHKMMGMTQQCTALLLADPEQLDACFATRADYLFQPDKLHAELDSGDRHFQCARRVDALKLWLAWRVHGDRGFADRIDRAVALADYARAELGRRDQFEIVVEGDFTNVVFRWIPLARRDRHDRLPNEPDPRTTMHLLAPAIKAEMQRRGHPMVGFQPIDDVNAFRLLVMNPAVTEADIDATLDAIIACGTHVMHGI